MRRTYIKKIAKRVYICHHSWLRILGTTDSVMRDCHPRSPPYNSRSAFVRGQTRVHFQAILATVGVSFRYGMWGEETLELGCTVVACLLWLGLGSLFSAAFLRVYHYHDVLVKKNCDMWPILCQVSHSHRQMLVLVLVNKRTFLVVECGQRSARRLCQHCKGSAAQKSRCWNE